jgi:hypothetical protein
MELFPRKYFQGTFSREHLPRKSFQGFERELFRMHFFQGTFPINYSFQGSFSGGTFSEGTFSKGTLSGELSRGNFFSELFQRELIYSSTRELFW